MKKLFFAIAVLFTTTLMAQKSSSPVAVKNAFTKAHPNATKVKYEKE
ncbi:MAG: hypothetical protein JWQ78_2232, partial [Sediminibacterium sp.]|nr:hypothetical protein [Sediminibacterium sp.]